MALVRKTFMSAISSTSAVTTGLLRNVEQNIGVTASLLKKATEADKDLVSTLLPAPSGSLDVKA